ncbi:MAG: 6-carboxytetrahydropterin synthase, partial [Gammaproteobacteria bacterium]
LVYVGGRLDEHTGWVMDFSDVATAFQPIFEQIDHRYLNEVEGLENPTSENLARWSKASEEPSRAGCAAVRKHFDFDFDSSLFGD